MAWIVWQTILLFNFCPFAIKAQETKPALFVHLDKTVYTGGEIIWFAGYLLNFKAEELSNYTTLYILLSDPVHKKTVLSTRFVLENGLSQGVLQIPDSFPAGEYAFVAYTDHLFRHPDDAVFQQWISVRYNNSSAIPFYQHFKDSACTRQPAFPVKALLRADSSLYHRRSKTHWTVQLLDSANHPVRGIFSVACVRKTRLIGREADIKQYQQTCFIIPNLLKDTIPPLSVQIMFNKKRLKEPTSFMIAGDNSFHLMQTEKDGKLSVSPTLLKGAYGTDVVLSVMEKDRQEFYSLNIDENDRIMNGLLTLRNWPLIISSSRFKEIFTPEEKEMDKTRLALVVVKGRVKPDYMHPEYYQLPIMDGPCAAWVCSCGHWKCLACPPARNPVKGCTYEDKSSHKLFTYKGGCPFDTIPKPFVKKIKAINYPRAFEAPDFDGEHGAGNFFNTTLYWNYLIITDKDGWAAFDFYSNDLSGTFTCTIQGYCTAGLVSSFSEMTVQDE